MTRQVLVLCSVFSLSLLAACGKDIVVETENQAPGAPSVSIGPTDARTDEDLVAVIDAGSEDVDGDTVAYSYAWSQDGVPRTDLTAATVPASETEKGDTWKVTVTPNDGVLDGDPGTAEITVLNTAPVVTVAFSSPAPNTDDDLVVVPTATDADGDAVTLSYAWTVEGVAADYTFDTVPADATERGQRWSVTVTPTDPEEAGLPVSAEVTIENRAPEVLTATLSPAAPHVSDDVMATVEGQDSDGDVITYSYRWFVDASEVQDGGSDTLVAGTFAKHQLISVEVTPNDGLDDGAAFASADATAINSQPTALNAVIDPATAYEGTPLSCVPSGFADADGDAEAWTYQWSVGGVDVATTSTLDGASFDKGDVLRCTATPWDGEESGASVTSTALTILDTPPVLASVGLSTYAPTENDTISVTLGVTTDADGDALTYGYDWYVNGTLVSTSTTLSANRFAKGDSIYVAVTPYDGSVFGAAVASATAVGTNTAPTMSSVALSPSAVYTNSTLTASVSAADLDGDSITYTYDWYVDGFPRGSSTSGSLSGATYFDKGQSVYVVVTPNDGETDGSSSTSSTIAVSNTAPTAPHIDLTPADPLNREDLTCEVTTAGSDTDGDALTYSFAWTVDGAVYTSAADGATSSVVDGADVDASQTWACSVTADDGEDVSPSTRASVTTSAGDYTTDYGNGMLLLSSGSFSMGSVTYGYIHTVTLTHDFWMGRTEVTQTEWAAWSGAPDTTPSFHAGCAECPVEGVDFADVAMYANALSAAEGLSLCYQADGSNLVASLGGDPYDCEGYRLPTEAEFEYAARAGTSYTYSGSNTIDSVGWTSANSGGATHDVATLASNSWGLYDMSGNVYEWTDDWVDASWASADGYSASPVTDPVGLSSGANRACRGGWYGDTTGTRVSDRGSADVGLRYYTLGFRIVRSVQ